VTNATVQTRRGDLYPLSELEAACGLVWEIDTEAEPLAQTSSVESPRQAFERALIAALSRPPCAVSFSGGRDSSAVLAVATHVARREGLPPPIPVTLRFPRCEESNETEWQERVIEHIGIDEWCRVELFDELDAVGPYAQQVLARHGSIWPFNAHFHAPIAEQVRGGSVVTGVGGDELLSAWPSRRMAMILGRQTTPRLRDVPGFARAVAPFAVRSRLNEREYRQREPYPWLRPDAQRAVARARGRAIAHEPLRWDESVRRYWWRSHYLRNGCESLRRVVADADGALAVHPFCDRDFLVAMARQCGRLGFRSRTQAMEALFGDVLPQSVNERTSKSFFNTAFWQRHGREFVRRWDGGGLDESVVETDALRAVWASERPHSHSFILLQRAWLHQNGLSAR
jgi:asparagine synthase (glutamine-hydrolysing)